MPPLRRIIALGLILAVGPLVAGCALAGQSGPAVRVFASAPVTVLPPATARFTGSMASPLVSAADFIDARRGWIGVTPAPDAVGADEDGGTLLRTTDGGRTWQIEARTSLPIEAIDFLTPTKGYVLTGTLANHFALYRTGNGGRTLALVSYPQAGAGKVAMHFSSMTHGFIASQNTLDTTDDGGARWQTSAAQPEPGDFGGPEPFAPGFLSSTTGVSMGGQGLTRTTDGGRTWQAAYAVPASDSVYGPVTFATRAVGYAALQVMNGAAESMLILRTDDGGASWNLAAGGLPGGASSGTPPPPLADALAAYGPHDVAVSVQGSLYTSRNAGVSWRRMAGVSLCNFYDCDVFAYTPDGSLLVDDESGTLWSLSARDTWHRVWPQVAVKEVAFVSPHAGFALASVGVDPAPELVRTADGGSTWRPVASTGNRRPVSHLSFADARHAFALGPSGVLATDNGGRSWQAIGIPDATSAQLLADGKGFVVANDNLAPPYLLATSDGGAHFVRLPLPSDLASTVRFVSSQVGFAVAPAAELAWVTEDGGRTWRTLALPKGAKRTSGFLAVQTDPEGDLWLLIGVPWNSVTPQELWIRHPDGSWQEVGIPAADVPPDTADESLDVVSSADAFLVTPSGLFATPDGGRVWVRVEPLF